MLQSYPMLQNISPFLSAFKFNDHGPQMLYIFFVFLPFPCMCTQYPILELLKRLACRRFDLQFPCNRVKCCPLHASELDIRSEGLDSFEVFPRMCRQKHAVFLSNFDRPLRPHGDLLNSTVSGASLQPSPSTVANPSDN